MSSNFLAVDLGASSGRVQVGCWDGHRFKLDEVHRFENGAVSVAGHLHWDVPRLWTDIKEGLSRYSRNHSEPPAGIGVDAWGVDFALVDGLGRLLGNPHHYRDARTEGMPAVVFARVPEAEIFAETGLQCWKINTLFQLFSMVQNDNPQLRAASTLLMIPDLFAYWLCGEKAVEHTIGGTSQMLVKRSHLWATELLGRLAIPSGFLPRVCDSGTVLAPLERELGRKAGFSSPVPVIAVASHDTASAVAAIPDMDAASVFISSGTWSLMGAEIDAPDVSAEAFRLGFTNESGAGGSVLLLRNLTGLWPLQECMRQWRLRGDADSWDEVMIMARQAEPFRSLVDPAAADFMAPDDMPAAIQRFCSRTGQPPPATVGEVARCCIESLSLSYLPVLEDIEKLTGRCIRTIRMVGGGCRNRLLCQCTADVTGLPVVAGPVEASAFGNVALQAIATGALSNVSQAREAIGDSTERQVMTPGLSTPWEEGYQRFRAFSS